MVLFRSLLFAFLIGSFSPLTAQTRIYWGVSYDDGGRIESALLDGTDRDTFIDGLLDPISMVFTEDSLYVADFGHEAIFVAGRRGGRTRRLRNKITPRGMTMYKGEIYVTLTREDRIAKLNRRTAHLETTLSRVRSPMWLAFYDGKMYWNDDYLETIERSNPDGTDKEILMTGVKGYSMQVHSGFIYWTGYLKTGVYRAKDDGSGGQLLIPTDRTTIGLKIHEGYVYWTETNYEESTVLRAKLDGSEPQVLVRNVGKPLFLGIEIR